MQNERNNLSKAMYHATKWSAITNVMRKLITPVTSMVLARLLTPDVFGVVASINMVVSFAEIFSDAGFQKYLVQHEFVDEKDLFRSSNVAFWTNFAISIMLWFGIFVFRDGIASLVGSDGYGFHLAVAGLAIPIVSFSSIQQALFRRNFDFKGMFVPRLVNSLIPIAVTIPLAYFTGSCWALIIGTLASNASDAVLLTLKAKWKPRLYFSFVSLKEMFSFSLWTMMESLSGWFAVNVDIFILGTILTSHYLGIYKTASTSVNQITTLITTTIIPVLFAGLSRYQSDEKGFADTLYSFQSKSAIILIPMSIGMFIYSDVVTWILLGEQWMEATWFVGLIGLLQAFYVLFANFAGEVYRAKGEPRLAFAVNIVYILLIVPGVLWGVKYSFNTLCTVKIGVKTVIILIHLLIIKLRFRMSLRKMFHNITSPLACSMVMAAAGCYMHETADSMMMKFVSIFVCVVIYFGCCMLFKDTRNIIRAFVKRH